jgi:hypothetical protein
MSEPDVLTAVEWYRSAKHLYTTVIHAMKAYYAYQKKPTPDNEKEMQRQFRLLHKALTRLNYGHDPLWKGGKK